MFYSKYDTKENSNIHWDLSMLFAFAEGCKCPEMVSGSVVLWTQEISCRSAYDAVLFSIRNFTLLLSMFFSIQTIIRKTRSKLPSNICIDFYLFLLIIVNIVK